MTILFWRCKRLQLLWSYLSKFLKNWTDRRIWFTRNWCGSPCKSSLRSFRFMFWIDLSIKFQSMLLDLFLALEKVTPCRGRDGFGEASAQRCVQTRSCSLISADEWWCTKHNSMRTYWGFFKRNVSTNSSDVFTNLFN